MITYYFYTFDYGRFCIVEQSGTVIRVDFANRIDIAKDFPADALQETPCIRETARQLKEYFQGQRQTFTVPIHPTGTPFCKKVWQALRKIPYGEVRTYGAIAKEIGCAKGARAVGMACNKNPIMLLIPCHRVIGADGSLTGYAGGLDYKEKFLRLEQHTCGSFCCKNRIST